MFPASFDKQDEDDQVYYEFELYNNFNFKQNLSHSDFDIIDDRSQLKQQMQNQKTINCGWRFDKINSMEVYFYKTTELKGLIYVKTLLRSSTSLKFENDDKYCLTQSILAHLHPCESSNPNGI